MFEFIKYYFEIGLYTKDNLATFKSAAMITVDQYNQLIEEQRDVAYGKDTQFRVWITTRG